MKQRTRLFWLLQIGGWLLYGVAILIALLPYMKLREALTFRAVLTGSCFLASLGLHLICRGLWRNKAGIFKIAVVVLSYCSVLGYVSAVAAIWTETKLFPMQWAQERMSLWLGSLNAGVNSAMVLVAWSALYFGFKHYEQIEAERRRVFAMEASARDAQLRALRYQVQPHFLFNTLNAISTLVVEGNPQAATSMISRLADFFRATLDEDGHETTLEQEIHLTEQYLAIEKTRLGERLAIEIHVAPAALDVIVPRMLLQPLAENSIRHCIAPRPSGGTLRIGVEREGERVRIKMSDTGNGTQPARAAESWRNGIGLANTEARLKQTYGADFRFQVQPSSLGGWEIMIELPVERKVLSAGAQS